MSGQFRSGQVEVEVEFDLVKFGWDWVRAGQDKIR